MKNILKSLLFITVFVVSGFVTQDIFADTNCTITKNDVYFDEVLTQEETESDEEILNKTVKLNIKTKDKCDNQFLSIQLWEKDTSSGDNEIDLTNGTTSTSMKIKTSESEDLWISYKAGEDDCDTVIGWNCEIYVKVLTENNEEILSTRSFLDGDLDSDEFFEDINYKKGVFVSECGPELGCEPTDWTFLTTNGTQYEENGPETTEIQQTFDSSSPCYTTTVVGGITQESYEENCYEFLAPIPGIQKDSEGNVDNERFEVRGDRIAIKDISTYALGDYINTLFQIAVAILAVISVIMIVIAGVQYMTVESIYGKSDAKKRITSAVGGLILALGIYTILWTINPQLLEVNFGSKLDQVSIKISKDINSSNIIGDSGATVTAYTLPSSNPEIYCPESGKNKQTINQVMNSFAGNTTYRIGGKGGEGNNNCPEGTVCLDCSGYANHLLRCSGFQDYPSQGTTGLFSSGAISVQPGSLNSSNFKKEDGTIVNLEVGDMLGWKNTDAGTTYGHVLVYVGDGKVTDSHGGSGKNAGNAIGLIDLKTATTLKQKIKWVRKAV